MAVAEVPAPEPEPEEPKPDDEPESGIRIAGKVYEGPSSFTLTEAQVIRANVDLTAMDLIQGADRDPTDPDVIHAISWVVLHRLDAKLEWEAVPTDDIDVGDFWVVAPEKKGGRGSPPGSRRKRSS